MKILHVQTTLSSTGNAAYKLHSLFLSYGMDSSLLVQYSQLEKDEKISKVNLFKRIFNNRVYLCYQQRFTKKRLKKEAYFYRNPVTTGFDLTKHHDFKQADIVYIHWAIGGFLSLKSIKKAIQTNKTIIIVLHDMWPITGGCHHSFDCNKYQSNCLECPMFINTGDSTPHKQLLFKRDFAEESHNLFFLSPSSWMTECAVKSIATANRPVFQIPHFVDIKIFRKTDKKKAKSYFNLPLDRKVIGFGAVDGLNNKFKGGQHLVRSLNFFFEQHNISDYTLLIFGSSELKMNVPAGIDIVNIGRIADYKVLSLAYNAMDIFITPSLAESFGMTALEAIACGTPVVCFDVGGLKDIVEHKENGYRAVLGNDKDLAKGIEYCMTNHMNFGLAEKFQPEANINSHMNIINEIKKENRSYNFLKSKTATQRQSRFKNSLPYTESSLYSEGSRSFD